MTKKSLYSLFCAGMLSSSLAFADANLSAQHQFVSVTNVNGGSEAVFDITINNIGSDNLNTLVFSAADNLLTQNMSAPVFELADLGVGTQSTLRVTLASSTSPSYFNSDSMLLLNVQAVNDLGQAVSTSVAVEGAVQ